LENVRNRYGKPIDKGALYKMLNNRTYIGMAVHKGTAYPGEHQAIIDRALWDKVHAILKESPRKRAAGTRVQSPALLKGLIFGPGGTPMTPTHTRRRGRLYRYYVTTSTIRCGVSDHNPIRRIPATEIEAAVVHQVKLLVQSPEIVVATWRAARNTIKGLTESQVREHLHNFSEVWSELFPAEQARIVQLLVAHVDISPAGADVTLRTDGLSVLMQNLRGTPEHQGQAA
jgi:site-specific DNA recombinase